MKLLLTALVFMGLSLGSSLHGDSDLSAQGFIVVLLGGPGSGKGTQAVEVSKQLNVPHISVGDLFRYNKQHNTVLGRKAAEFMDKGLLVPDSLAIEVLANRVAEPDSEVGYILDGFPRTIPQATELSKNLVGKKRLVVLNLDVSDAELEKRLMGRKREDDTPDVVRQRLKVYHDQTEPLIAYYKAQGVLVDIDGAQSKEKVLSDITAALEQQGITAAQH